jgi:hypothetical protein
MFVRDKHFHGQTNLPHVIGAVSSFRDRNTASRSREQKRGKNADGSNDSQKLSQRKSRKTSNPRVLKWNYRVRIAHSLLAPILHTVIRVHKNHRDGNSPGDKGIAYRQGAGGIFALLIFEDNCKALPSAGAVVPTAAGTRSGENRPVSDGRDFTLRKGGLDLPK